MNLILAVLFQLSFLVLTVTTGIFGAAPLIVLYRTHSKGIVYPLQALTIAAALSAKAPILALIVLCINVMVACYLKLEKKNLYQRAIISVLAGAGLYLVALWGYAELYAHQNIWAWLTQEMDFYIKQSKALLGDIHFDLDLLVYQVPSFIIVVFSLNLWLAVLIDSKAQKKFGALKADVEIKNFKVPELLIWVAIGSLLFSFIKTPVPGLQEAALNVLNLSLLLYFFQGLSVVSYIMTIFNVGTLLKIIVYCIFIAQLLLPICLGVLDFWLNFRNKISKRKI